LVPPKPEPVPVKQEKINTFSQPDFGLDLRYKPKISNENGLPILQLDISSAAAISGLKRWYKVFFPRLLKKKFEKANDDRQKLKEEILKVFFLYKKPKKKQEAISTFEIKSKTELAKLSEEYGKVNELVKQIENFIKITENDIENAAISKMSIGKKMKEKSPEHMAKSPIKNEADRLKMKFELHLLDETEVIKHIEREIDEFYKWVALQTKQLKPIRQNLITELSNIVHSLDNDLDVVFICKLFLNRLIFMGLMLRNYAFHPLT